MQKCYPYQTFCEWSVLLGLFSNKEGLCLSHGANGIQRLSCNNADLVNSL